MKTLYLDCFAGISGDMVLGALIDVGADAEMLRKSLSGLGVQGFTLQVGRKCSGHIDATDVQVVLDDHHHHHRRLGDILGIIESADLSDRVKETAGRIFRRLAEAEAKVHGSSPEDVHFHEVGAVDAIVDIVGSAICLELLGWPGVVASPLPTFHGFANGAHGTFPLPAPATLELLQSVPWRHLDVEGELVTPTGAAIVTTVASEFGAMPAMTVESIGYGSGNREYGFPNVLRAMLGEASQGMPTPHRVSVIETNIDDLNPQFYEQAMERLFAAGALDVFLSPIQMKKNRPATLLSVICSPERVSQITEIVLSQTSTLGVRVSQWERICLNRRWEDVATAYGTVRMKIGEMDGRIVNFSPEYDDCKRASEEHGVPVKLVHDAAVAAFSAGLKTS